MDEKVIKELLQNVDDEENYKELMNFINNRRVELKTEFERLTKKLRKREQPCI